MPKPSAPPANPPKESLAHQLLNSLLSVAFPSACILCGQDLERSAWGGPCEDCWQALQAWSGPICHRCGLPLAGSVKDPGYLCGGCRVGALRFDFARSYGVYSSRLRAAVLELKFHQRERLGTRLGSLLLEPWETLRAAASITGTVLIVPVPLHRARERERGYNQAKVLAEGFVLALTRKKGVGSAAKIDSRCLVRKSSTTPQSGLSLHARSENVRGVFTASERVQGQDVVLVDDVMTTGATVSACAVALKRAGARRVAVLALARATPQFPDVAAAHA
jgi:ComF family protein